MSNVVACNNLSCHSYTTIVCFRCDGDLISYGWFCKVRLAGESGGESNGPSIAISAQGSTLYLLAADCDLGPLHTIRGDVLRLSVSVTSPCTLDPLFGVEWFKKFVKTGMWLHPAPVAHQHEVVPDDTVVEPDIGANGDGGGWRPVSSMLGGQ